MPLVTLMSCLWKHSISWTSTGKSTAADVSDRLRRARPITGGIEREADRVRKGESESLRRRFVHHWHKRPMNALSARGVKCNSCVAVSRRIVRSTCAEGSRQINFHIGAMRQRIEATPTRLLLGNRTTLYSVNHERT